MPPGPARYDAMKRAGLLRRLAALMQEITKREKPVRGKKPSRLKLEILHRTMSGNRGRFKHLIRAPTPHHNLAWKLGIKEVNEGIWLVSFMHYDLGYFDLEQKTLQPLDNPFGTRLSAMS